MGARYDRSMSDLSFRRLAREDFAQLATWLETPHVARWWNHESSTAALERDFGPTIDGMDLADIFVVSLRERPIGLIQRYTFADNPHYADEVATLSPVPAAACSIDYFVGEPDLLRTGVGTAMLRALLRMTWDDEPAAPAVIVPVSASNVASWRVLERSGFRRVAEGPLRPDNPIDDDAHFVYRIDRPLA
jgi:aminoglycoside 6'-N-acetyltransferase